MDYVIIYTILKFQLFNGLGYKSPTLLIYLQTFWKIPENFSKSDLSMNFWASI